MPTPRTTLSLVPRLALLVSASACIFSHENGTVEDAPPQGRTYTLSGFAYLPGETVRIEILDPADQNPYAANSTWSELTTVSVSTFSWRGLHSWNASITPVENSSQQDRWTPGGLARIRATAVEYDYPLVIFDDLNCVLDNIEKPLLDIQELCESPDSPILTIVNTNQVPAAPASSFAGPTGTVYLTAFRSSAAQAAAYYNSFDAPPDFEAFRERNGFATNNDVSAAYFNDLDLGLGRDMHCRHVTACEAEACAGIPNTDCAAVVRTACYVTNYADGFSGDSVTALNDLVAAVASDSDVDANVGDTVAMERLYYDPSTLDCQNPGAPSPPAVNDVRFMVYGTFANPNGGANLEMSVQLDPNNGRQEVPGLCMNCHGGTYEGSSVRGSRFLPFDVDSFIYADPYPYGVQAEAFRELNEMVLDADLHGRPDNTQTPIADLINTWYGMDGTESSVRTPGADFDDDEHVPASWAGDPHTYRDLISPSCRMCHVAFEDTAKPVLGFLSSTQSLPTFASATDFAGYATTAAQRVCTAHDMPHSRRTFEKMWESNGRVRLVRPAQWDHDCAP